MGQSHDVNEMYRRLVEAFRGDGKLSVDELDHILSAALQDGVFQDEERQMLIDIISSLSSGDFTPELWDRVEQLVREFDLSPGA